MYCLIKLQEDEGPSPKVCCYKTGTFNDMPLKDDGRIYGNDLLNYLDDPNNPSNTTGWPADAIVPKRYSRWLIELMWQCLCNTPRNRVDLVNLHRIIDIGIANKIAANNAVCILGFMYVWIVANVSTL